MAALKAIVKSVISGDTLVLRSRASAPGQPPPKERILHIADISAPRMGSSTREDEPWAYECRENLRALLVGKEVTFVATYQLPPSTTDPGVQRDLGNVEFNGVDLATDILRTGWAKVKEGKKGELGEEDLRKKDLEADAKSASRGIWKAEGPTPYTVNYSMPVDSQGFLREHKDNTIEGIVEQVRDGSTLRIRLLLPNNVHQMVNTSMAGIRCAKAAFKDGEHAEPWAEEAKFFTESRMLQRQVRVRLLSVPAPAALPFSSAATQAPTPASMFIGTVMHPNGNIAEHLVANGLARVVDWHAGMLSTVGGMERLRSAEAAAKEKKQYLYASSASGTAAPSGTRPNGAAAYGDKRSFEGPVTRIWSGDQISVLDKETNKERRVQLSSTRAPKGTDPKQAYWAAEAKEFLRKKIIGKNVRGHIDFIRPKEGEYDERECVSIRFGGNNANLAEQIIEKGLATVVRHKRDDEDRSPDFDKLMAAEQAAVNDKRGMHSGKEAAIPKLVNASENHARATQYLSGFKRQKRVPAIVDYVAAGSRFKILLPRDNVTLTLVLAGIRAPKTARNESEKSEPYGPEAAAFASHRYMQRDVEIEFDAVDKSGGFIGTMFVNRTENSAITLVKEGLASVHAYSAEGLSWSTQLLDAETEAKAANKGMWRDHQEKEAEPEPVDEVPRKVEYIDVIISDVRTEDFGFSVQILNTEGIESLEKLMRDFSLHHKTAPPVPGFIPRNGDLVSARFSDGSWYRAKVRRASPQKKEAEVTFIDYGNKDSVSFANIRPLDPKFRGLSGQAHDARLSLVRFVSNKSEYYEDAVHRFRTLCEGRKLIAVIDYKEGPLLHLRLIDPSDPASSTDPDASINADLVREGFATVDKKGTPGKYLNNHPSILTRLAENLRLAKRERLGQFELGDVEEDDD